MRAALFDMDRTLLATDTASLYTRYRRDRGEVGALEVVRVGYWLLQYTLGIIDAERVARRALRDFAGKSESTLIETTEEWFETYVQKHVRDAARRAVERHRASGDVLAIVTGATPYAARPLARVLGIEHVVASELEVDARGCLTGRPLDPICYGQGKVTRAERLAERLGFRLEEAVFYSDSITDLPLLERVGTPVAVCPDRRLARVAASRGWRIERW
ncbi:MAG: HAD family hydrolase [Pseudomonadota bacterium]